MELLEEKRWDLCRGGIAKEESKKNDGAREIAHFGKAVENFKVALEAHEAFVKMKTEEEFLIEEFAKYMEHLEEDCIKSDEVQLGDRYEEEERHLRRNGRV